MLQEIFSQLRRSAMARSAGAESRRRAPSSTSSGQLLPAMSTHAHCPSLREGLAFVELALDGHDLRPTMVDGLRPVCGGGHRLPRSEPQSDARGRTSRTLAPRPATTAARSSSDETCVRSTSRPSGSLEAEGVLLNVWVGAERLHAGFRMPEGRAPSRRANAIRRQSTRSMMVYGEACRSMDRAER